MKDEKLNLDVDAPDKVIEVLIRAIDAYQESASELQSAWQDKNAGQPWIIIAEELDRACTRIGKRFAESRY